MKEFERAEMHMIKWMCGVSMKDRRTGGSSLGWYGHVMRKGDDDWVNKCMEFGVEGRRPVGRPRRTWLESVEADMAELEIDKEDAHDRKKWRRNVMKRKSTPIGKGTINRK